MWTKERIHELLDGNDAAVIRGMYAIQARQTADEQAGHLTKHTNGIGWSKFDAEWMGEMIDGHRKWGRLTPKQMAVTRNKLKRYHRQLCEIANERDGVTVAKPTIVQAAPPVEDDQGRYLDEREAYDRAMAEELARESSSLAGAFA